MSTGVLAPAPASGVFARVQLRMHVDACVVACAVQVGTAACVSESGRLGAMSSSFALLSFALLCFDMLHNFWT